MPSRQPPPHHQHHHLLHLPLLLTSSLLLLLLLLLFLLRHRLLLLRHRPRTVPSSSSPSLNPNHNHHLRRYSFSLLRRATSSFSPSSRLGQGGFGSVFLATISPSLSVAVKLMHTSDSLQSLREFHNEISLANRINLDSDSCSRFLVRILGFAEEDRKGKMKMKMKMKMMKRKLIVYELMRNGSLQEKLLDLKCEELMDWEKRFGVVVGVAKGLEYLHFMCGRTPVIHGDVKPSNVLLDEDYNAKLGDFGLARILEEEDNDNDNVDNNYVDNDDFGVDVRVVIEKQSECGMKANEETESVVTGYEESSSIVAAEQSPGRSTITTTATGTTTTTRMEGSPLECYEKMSVSERSCVEKLSVDESENNRRVGNGKKKGVSGKDWWWKQDNVGGFDSGRVKDYVMEWIGNEIKKERPKSEWNSSPGVAITNGSSVKNEAKKTKKKKRRLDWWGSMDEDKIVRKKEKCRKPREWWKEEFCEELTKKKKKNKKKKGSKANGDGDMWWQRDEDFTPERNKKRRTRSNLGSIDWWLDGLSGELRGGRRNSQDGCDIPKSGGISSTPSMRGTVCYIAPEYSGGGELSEKCDVYSFGVLVLVVLSGRRPLQVMASPMSEFDRANLISWARQLAYNGKLLDLIDPTIRSLDKEQALLCITIALLCLQRTPGKRPNMKEVVEMLTGVAEPPHLPFEFSPSPPSNFSFKSRKKPK